VLGHQLIDAIIEPFLLVAVRESSDVGAEGFDLNEELVFGDLAALASRAWI